MITLLRIDDRLIHGQVAYGWTQALDVSVILIVNDDVATNEMQKNRIQCRQTRWL